MKSALTSEEGRGLTKESLERLLAALDKDRERAGEKYELLRRKLVKFFEWRACGVRAIDLADETINRVARRIDEGTEVLDVSGYAYGVGRRIFREWLREVKQAESLRDAAATDVSSRGPLEAALRECFEACLGKQPADNRELIVAYYQDQRRPRIELRRELAERVGVPINGLRVRAHRIRLKLEECVSRCLQSN
jgi:RNA polymerase sigma factor (sigma-70 family)